MCKNFQFKGECSYGGLCRFAHGEFELRNKVISNMLYKTKQCKQWQQNNYCPYGYRCQYLHQVSYEGKQVQSRFEKLLKDWEEAPVGECQQKQTPYNRRLQVFRQIFFY